MNKDYWIITDYPHIKTSELIEEAKKLLPGLYLLKDYEDFDKQFPAPKEMEISMFRKTIESDKEHKGKSYDDFMSEGKEYMTMRQYLILFLQIFKTTGECLDVQGWTRTSSLWSDGNLVFGYWYGVTSKLELGNGSRGGRDSGDGPRERFSFPFQPLSLIEIGGKKYKKEEVEERLKELKSYS